MNLHASSVAIDHQAVLITGASGAGKSDLALRLVDDGAVLIADDQTLLHVKDGVLIATAPATIAGLIEARHVGLLRLPYVASAPVALLVELVTLDTPIERLPEDHTVALLGCSVRRLRLPAFAASTPAKIRAALLYPSAEGCGIQP